MLLAWHAQAAPGLLEDPQKHLEENKYAADLVPGHNWLFGLRKKHKGVGPPADE